MDEVDLFRPLEDVQPPVFERLARFGRFVVFQLDAFDGVGFFREEAGGVEVWFRWGLPLDRLGDEYSSTMYSRIAELDEAVAGSGAK